MVILQRKNETRLSFALKIISKGKELLSQPLNLSLRVRLKDDLVQWQLKKSSDTDPVTFGLRCSGPEDAQRLENLLKDIRYNLEVDQRTSTPRKATEEMFVKAHLPDNQSTKVAVAGGMTVNSLFVLIAARRRLDPTLHEIRINQGKYLAAVKPTLAVHSLGVKEVYIVQVHNYNRSQGSSRIITIRLPNKKDTYIQVKDQRKVRDLYSYICDKKELTPSLYRLKYNCKIEGEKDMDKTIGQLDLWSVELETVQKTQTPVKQPLKPAVSVTGVEETDSGPTPGTKVERKPKRAAPPPPPSKKKESVTPTTTPAAPPKGVPLIGMAGKKIAKVDTPPVQRDDRSSSAVTQESTYSTDEDDDASFFVVNPSSTSTPRPPAVPTQAFHSETYKSGSPVKPVHLTQPPQTPPKQVISKSQSSSAVSSSSPGRPKRRAPVPPCVGKSKSVSQESTQSTFPTSQSEQTVSTLSMGVVSTTPDPVPRRMGRNKTESGQTESPDSSPVVTVVGRSEAIRDSTESEDSSPQFLHKIPRDEDVDLPAKVWDSPPKVHREAKSEPVEEPLKMQETPAKNSNDFDNEFDDINSFFNSIIAEADTHLKDNPEDEILPSSKVERSRVDSVPPVAKPRNSPPTSALRSQDEKAKGSPIPVPRRTPPNSSPSLSIEREGFNSNENSDSSSPSRKQSGLVMDSTGKQMLVVYPSPGSKRKGGKDSLAFEIPPPPPLEPDTCASQPSQDQDSTTEEDLKEEEQLSDDEKDRSSPQHDKEDSTYSDSESEQEAHYILGLTPSASFDVPAGEEENIETVRHAMVDIAKSDLVTTSFSEETNQLEENDSDKQVDSDMKPDEEIDRINREEVDGQKSAGKPDINESIPPPLPTPKISAADGMGFFLPPPDEFEAPKPPLPSCSPPDSTDDEFSPYTAVTVQPSQPVNMRMKNVQENSKSNRPISVHGNLINVISNLQGLLSGDDEEEGSNGESKMTDFSKPLAESQGESSEDDDTTFTIVEPAETKHKPDKSVPQPPPLPAVLDSYKPPQKVSNPPPPPPPASSAAVTTPKKNPPPVMKKPIKTPPKQPSAGDVEQELKAKLKRRQERITEEDITENKPATFTPGNTQSNTGLIPGVQTNSSGVPGVQPNAGLPGMPSNAGLPGMPPNAGLPGMPPNAGLPGMPVNAGVSNQVGVPMDPQQMLLQQQLLQQQVMQLQQQLQLLQQMQGSSPANSMQGMPMMNSTLQMQQMLMMMSQGNPQPNQNMSNSNSNPSMSQGNSLTNLMMGMSQMPAMPANQPPPATPTKLSKGGRSVTSLNDVTSIRSERLGEMEDDFDKVMEEVRDTNPMTILRKVNGPSQVSSSRKSSQMEDALFSAMKDRRTHLDRSRNSQHEDDMDSSW
jgi:hypothetical protein